MTETTRASIRASAARAWMKPRLDEAASTPYRPQARIYLIRWASTRLPLWLPSTRCGIKDYTDQGMDKKCFA
ncbi:uncharacterized protein UV8b_00018 [Ustilaginoidea virens]|uniref:Uncharacterized protein n=1 Tax=Ustilaginoidea virens TaxID=1159556 RepID=A0A8E5HIB8_USTVR|nr:uncharacterized protein UV8b_00018 [Ustilaginoidea virens]QUC15777.1 hypothetical protein UV8b_00018 [Ustilaginoidea virens]